MGSLKVGKDADVVVWSGNPLSIYAKAETTIDKINIQLNYSGIVTKFSPKFTSSNRPELTNNELLKIIKTGVATNLKLIDKTIKNTEDYSAIKFVDKNINNFLFTPIENKVLNDFNLYFSVNSPILENLIKKNNSEDSNAISKNLLLNTSFSVGKYLFKNLYLKYKGTVVNLENQNDFNENDYTTKLKSEIEAKYKFNKSTFFKYKFSPALEKEKDSEHFFMFEKTLKY